ncbi:YfbK domain-containing protein [Yoonia sp.]|uniref:YfbK domain-containing protein n=1 Tax=Yoonia sp. TaxID=2212373 RepID=UPI0035C7F694
MTDDLSDLRAKMDDAMPRPDVQRRQQDLALASANFARLHAPKGGAVPAVRLFPSKAWFGGTLASLAVVATAVVLFVPSSAPVPLGPTTANVEGAMAEVMPDVALAPQEAPQVLSRSTTSPTSLATQNVPSQPEATAILAETALSYQKIGQLLRQGQLPSPAAVDVSALLSGVADSLLRRIDSIHTASLPTPWNGDAYLVLNFSPSRAGVSGLAIDETWRLLGSVQQDIGTVDVYQAPIAVGEQANEDSVFIAAVTGFALLLQGEASLDTWSFDEALALARRGTSDDPVRLEMLELMERARDLSP